MSAAVRSVVVWTRSWCAYQALPSFMSLAPIVSRHFGRYSSRTNTSKRTSAVSIGSNTRSNSASSAARSSAVTVGGGDENGLRSESRRPRRAAPICAGTCTIVTFGGMTPCAMPARITSSVASSMPGTPSSRLRYAW